jgi:thiamine-phosphate pyrophosphorylase
VDPLPRILDANANRAFEALRTLEDIARFAAEDQPLCAALKELRHELAAALRRFPSGWILANRSTADDVGTGNATEGEYRRGNLADVATAAASRLGESLRVIEECSKTIDPTIAREVEGIRYRAYDRAARAVTRAPGRCEQWRVCVLMTERLCTLPWRDVVRESIEGGAEAIQVREKELDAGALSERVAWIVDLARPAGVRVIVNDRPDIAIVTGADGVHVGQTDLAPSQVRQLCGKRLIVGMSTHDAAEAQRAMDEGADYCGVGAMFPTAVKPTAAQVGIDWLREYLARFGRVPHLAIGGVTGDNISLLVAAGCRGVAVSNAVCASDRPADVVRALRAAFR